MLKYSVIFLFLFLTNKLSIAANRAANAHPLSCNPHTLLSPSIIGITSQEMFAYWQQKGTESVRTNLNEYESHLSLVSSLVQQANSISYTERNAVNQLISLGVPILELDIAETHEDIVTMNKIRGLIVDLEDKMSLLLVNERSAQ